MPLFFVNTKTSIMADFKKSWFVSCDPVYMGVNESVKKGGRVNRVSRAYETL